MYEVTVETKSLVIQLIYMASSQRESICRYKAGGGRREEENDGISKNIQQKKPLPARKPI